MLGYATAWLGVNPISVVGIWLGISTRWMVAHHVLHRGYDHTAGGNSYHSTTFGRGLRRWVDWCDWLAVKPWVREHNGLHHFRLGESYDPDIPEVNFDWLAKWRIPTFLKYMVFMAAAVSWKWSYYGPRILQIHAVKGVVPAAAYSPISPATWSPFNPSGRQVWLQSWLPYPLVRFGLLPLPFLALGHAAWISVILNSLLAEICANVHSFVVVATNHGGHDLPRFSSPAQNKNEQRLRQIVGSVNFKTGGDLNDFLHGWLNYQIEHHVWPDLSLRQYQTWQPHLRELCLRYEVPYCQQSVWRRVGMLMHNVVGSSRMHVLSSLAIEGSV